MLSEKLHARAHVCGTFCQHRDYEFAYFSSFDSHYVHRSHMEGNLNMHNMNYASAKRSQKLFKAPHGGWMCFSRILGNSLCMRCSKVCIACVQSATANTNISRISKWWNRVIWTLARYGHRPWIEDIRNAVEIPFNLPENLNFVTADSMEKRRI